MDNLSPRISKIFIILLSFCNSYFVFGQNKNKISYKDSEFSFPVNLGKIQKILKLNFENGLCYNGTLDENSIQAFYDDIGQVLTFGDQKVNKKKFRKSNIYAISFENIDSTHIKKYISNMSQKYNIEFINLKNTEPKLGSIFYNFEPNFYKSNLSDDVVVIIYQFYNKQINKNIISTSFCYGLKQAEIEEFVSKRGFLISRYLSKTPRSP